MEKLLIHTKIKLERSNTKGSWTYLLLPQIDVKKDTVFGGLKVNGFIDDYVLENVNLMPYGGGRLFLPVKSAIRKVIKKEAGDWVELKLFMQSKEEVMPEDFLESLKDVPAAHKNFGQFSRKEQEVYLNWITASPNDEMRIERIVAALERIELGLTCRPK